MSLLHVNDLVIQWLTMHMPTDKIKSDDIVRQQMVQLPTGDDFRRLRGVSSVEQIEVAWPVMLHYTPFPSPVTETVI